MQRKPHSGVRAIVLCCAEWSEWCMNSLCHQRGATPGPPRNRSVVNVFPHSTRVRACVRVCAAAQVKNSMQGAGTGVGSGASRNHAPS